MLLQLSICSLSLSLSLSNPVLNQIDFGVISFQLELFPYKRKINYTDPIMQCNHPILLYYWINYNMIYMLNILVNRYQYKLGIISTWTRNLSLNVRVEIHSSSNACTYSFILYFCIS